MPRYLATDYVHQAERHYRSILNELLLSVPEHLEQVESYSHQGKVYDTSYRRPWKQVRNKKFDINENEPLKITSQIVSGTERFGSDEDSLEVIPSSNPCSQVEITDVAPQKVEPCLCDEEFSLQNIEVALKQDDEWMLEEPLCDDHLYHCKKQLPGVNALHGRLKPKHVTDPFTTADGQSLSESAVLRNDRVFCSINQPDTRLFEIEEFDLETHHDLDEIKLEENLLYPLCEEGVDGSVLKEHTTDLKTVLQLTPEPLPDEKQDVTEMMKRLLKDLVDNMPDVKPNEYAIPGDYDEVKREKKDMLEVFQQLNSQDASDEDTDCEGMVLESPAFVFSKEKNPSDAVSSLKSTLNLQDVNMGDEEYRTLLHPRSKQLLEGLVWENEKYFTDISVLRLKEISPDGLKRRENAVDQAKRAFNLKIVEGIRLLELELPWDPLVETLEPALRMSKDMLRYDKTATEATKEKHLAVEVFEKIDLSKLRDIGSDSTLPIVDLSGFQRTRNMVQNKTRDIPRFSVEKQLRQLEKAEMIKEANRAIYSEKHSENGRSEIPNQSVDTLNVEKSNLQNGTPAVTYSADPLDSFIWMRNNMKGISTPGVLTGSAKRYKPVREITEEDKLRNLTSQAASLTDQGIMKTTQSETKHHESDSNQVSSKQENSETHDKCDKVKAESKTIEVTLPDSYVDLWKIIEEAAQSLLSELQSRRILPSDQNFSTLTPDITKFINRQYEHSQHPDIAQDALYRTLLMLHVLVTSAYLLVHCCLPSAIQALRIIGDKHSALKDNGPLNSLHQILCDKQYILDKERIMHPKLEILVQLVISFIKESPKSKVLVICNKGLQTFLEYVQGVLAAVKEIKPILHGNSEESLEQLMRNTNSNCVVTLDKLVNDDFPWNQFSCVIEYNPVTDSRIRKACEKLSVNYVGLKANRPEGSLVASRVISPSSKVETDASSCSVSEQANETTESSAMMPYKFIGSTVVTANSALLHFLESRCNIEILERDYAALRKKGNHLHFADIDVDAQTGIILQNLSELQDTSTAESLVVKLVSISGKYRYCWLLLTPHSRKRYALGGPAVINMARLYSAVSYLCSDTFLLNVLVCENEEKVANIVRRVALETHAAAQEAGDLIWSHRDFLQYNMSKHEQFLLTFPCLNSLSAQTLLSKLTLLEVLAASYDKLNLLYPRLPHSVVKEFCKLKREGTNMPTDHGDGLNRDTKEWKTRKGNAEYSATSPEASKAYQDFNLQVYGGARSDTTYGSEHECSNNSYEEQEVPDVESLGFREPVNEYEMAEMEGAARLMHSYPKRSSGDYVNKTTEQMDHTLVENQTPITLPGRNESFTTATDIHLGRFEHPERSIAFKRHYSGGLPRLPNIQRSRPHDECQTKQAGQSYEMTGEGNTQSARISRSREPRIGGQSACKPDFFEESSSQVKPRFQIANPGNASTGFWTHFSDTLNSTDRQIFDKTEARNTFENVQPLRIRNGIARASRDSNRMIANSLGLKNQGREDSKTKLMELMAETPRMHQPYTRPHHRHGQNSFWQMPNRPPSVAAVTPNQRKSVPVSEFLQIGTSTPRGNLSTPRGSLSSLHRMRGLSQQDSPPMDPDSDEESPLRWRYQPMFDRDGSDYQVVADRRSQARIDIPGPLRARAAEYRKSLEKANEAVLSKKRKLTYERIPGMKGGQTRLSFA